MRRGCRVPRRQVLVVGDRGVALVRRQARVRLLTVHVTVLVRINVHLLMVGHVLAHP